MHADNGLDPANLSLEELKELLIKEESIRRRSIRLMVGAGIGLLVVYCLLFAVQLARGSTFDWDFLLTQLGLVGCFTSVWGVTQNHKRALKQASLWRAPELVPHLLEVLDADSSEVRSVCESALGCLLPKLTTQHAGLFQLNHLKRLMRIAKSNRTDLASHAVRALGKVGDRHTAPELENFASSRKKGDPFSEKLAALALESAADLRLELARTIVTARSDSLHPTHHCEEHEAESDAPSVSKTLR